MEGQVEARDWLDSADRGGEQGRTGVDYEDSKDASAWLLLDTDPELLVIMNR